jgi:hypothetical protein
MHESMNVDLVVVFLRKTLHLASSNNLSVLHPVTLRIHRSSYISTVA